MLDGARERIRARHGPQYGIGAIIGVMSDHLAECGVTRKEAEVLDAVGELLTNAEIAARMYISERTVESHVSSLLRKLGAGDRRELARRRLRATTAPTPPAEGVPPPALPAALELLAAGSTFVGRESERELLRRQWTLARGGHTLLVLVSGEAGMGKSRLVSELAAEVHANGGRVLLGACYEDVDQPYGPFAQAISADVANLADAEVIGRVEEGRRALARLSPEIARAVSVPGSQKRGTDVDVSERGVMLDAIERWLFASASTAPLLLVVEDIHWSTSTTRDVLRHLARRAGPRPLLVVATTRDTAPDLDDDLETLLGDLERSPAVSRLSLRGLDRDEVAALVDVNSADVDAIAAETGGNPLLVTCMTADGRGGSLHALLSHRDALLDDGDRALLDLAATFGSEFDADMLAAGQGAPLLSVLDSLESAEAAGLVVPHPGRVGQFGFVHALFRSHRYRALPLRRRLELHAKAAVALAARPSDDQLLSERARHACLAVPVGDARTAVDLAREAAHQAEHAYAYDEAAAHYRRALDAARALDPPDPRTALDLNVRLAAALHHNGDPQGLPMLLDAAHRARDERDDAALVRAALSFSHFGATFALWGLTPELSVIEDALATLGDKPSAARARLLIELGSGICFVEVDESIELARQAEAMAREVADLDALGHVLLGARHIAYHPSRLEEFERIGAELEHLGHRLRSLALTLAGLGTQAEALLQRGETGRWAEETERYSALLGDHSLAFFQLGVLLYRAQRAFLSGDLERAEELALAMVPLAHGTGTGSAVWTGSIVILNRRLQARDVELRPALERVIGRRDVMFSRCTLAAVEARTGSVREARRRLEGLRNDGFAIPESYPWTLAMTELAEAAEVAGDPESAAHVLAVASPYSGRIAVSGPCVNRPFDQALAQAALATGDSARAEEYAARAVAASRKRNTPGYLCRELVFLAEARRRNGASQVELRPLVEEASTVAARIGAQVVVVDLARYGLSA